MDASSPAPVNAELAALKAQVLALTKAFDPKRLEATMRYVEREQNSKSIRVIGPHSDYPVTPDDPRNGVEVLATNTTLAAQNAANINSVIAQSFVTAPSGRAWAMTLPGPVLRIDTTPIDFSDMGGFEVLLAGANLGQGNTPDATSWYKSASGSGTNFWYGFELYGTGYGSTEMVRIDDCSMMRWRGGGLRAIGTDPAAYGMRIGKGSTAGSGPSTGTLYFEQVGFVNCDVAVNVGRVATSGGGYAATNCSEIVMMQPTFLDCPVGYETMHGQAVNHILIQPQFGDSGGVLYRATGGGSMLILNANTYNADAVIEVATGGSGVGVNSAINTRMDGDAKQTKLFNATDDGFNVAVFFCANATFHAGTANGARATLRDNNFVWVYHAHNMTNGSLKPMFETAESGAKTAFIQGSFLETSSAGFIDRDILFGTIHSGTEWQARACIDGTSSRYTFAADMEYPRRNGRCSTHRFRVEDDFTHNADGMRGFAVSASGAGAGSDIVFPWAAKNVGIQSLNTGTTDTGSSACITDVEAMCLTGGPWIMEVLAKLIVLSVPSGGNPDPGVIAVNYQITTSGGVVTGVTGTDSDNDEQFTVRVGFNSSADGDGDNAVEFRYTDTVNSGKWEAVTRDGGSETAEDTGITADQEDILFEIRINAAGTEARFYINGTLTNTITTNLPDATDYMGMMPGSIKKSAGTNNRSFHIDYAYYDNFPSTARATAFNK